MNSGEANFSGSKLGHLRVLLIPAGQQTDKDTKKCKLHTAADLGVLKILLSEKIILSGGVMTRCRRRASSPG